VGDRDGSSAVVNGAPFGSTSQRHSWATQARAQSATESRWRSLLSSQGESRNPSSTTPKKTNNNNNNTLSLSGLSSLPGEGVYRCAPVGGELHLRTADDEEAVPSGGQRRHVCGAESHRYRQREVGGGPPVRVWRIRAHNGAINRTRKSRQGDELLAAISAEAAAHVLRDSGQGPAGIPGVGGASGGPVGTKFATHRGPDLRHVHGRQRRLDAGRGRGGGRVGGTGRHRDGPSEPPQWRHWSVGKGNRLSRGSEGARVRETPGLPSTIEDGIQPPTPWTQPLVVLAARPRAGSRRCDDPIGFE